MPSKAASYAITMIINLIEKVPAKERVFVVDQAFSEFCKTCGKYYMHDDDDKECKCEG